MDPQADLGSGFSESVANEAKWECEGEGEGSR